MEFTTAGIILLTQNYEACLTFYGSVLGLKAMHKIDRPGERLTTFALGGSYLMVETGGVASDGVKNTRQCPTKLRFNVPDVMAAAAVLRGKGLEVEVLQHSWGTTAEFVDPDGNPYAIRSDAGFGE